MRGFRQTAIPPPTVSCQAGLLSKGNIGIGAGEKKNYWRKMICVQRTGRASHMQKKQKRNKTLTTSSARNNVHRCIIITFYISPYFSSFVGNRQAFYTDVCSCVFQIFVRRRRCGRWWYRRKILPEHYLLHRLMIIAGGVCEIYFRYNFFREMKHSQAHGLSSHA